SCGSGEFRLPAARKSHHPPTAPGSIARPLVSNAHRFTVAGTGNLRSSSDGPKNWPGRFRSAIGSAAVGRMLPGRSRPRWAAPGRRRARVAGGVGGGGRVGGTRGPDIAGGGGILGPGRGRSARKVPPPRRGGTPGLAPRPLGGGDDPARGVEPVFPLGQQAE